MDQIATWLFWLWTFFAKNILTQPAFMIGTIVLIGYILLLLLCF